MKRVALLVVVALLAGCSGDDNEAASTETATVTTPAKTSNVRVYFLRDGKVWPVAREVTSNDAWNWAMQELFKGPTAKERQVLGARTAVPGDEGAYSFDKIPGVASFSTQREYPRTALAQVVYTAMQFPGIKAVEFNHRRYTRGDFEDQTPGILVESPLPFEQVSSPIRATGTANTFEATFNYELTDTDGKIVDQNFVTATSGTGTRGTFDFTTKPFTVPFDGVGSLVVYEPSAKDGSRTKLVEIPLRMSQ